MGRQKVYLPKHILHPYWLEHTVLDTLNMSRSVVSHRVERHVDIQKTECMFHCIGELTGDESSLRFWFGVLGCNASATARVISRW